MEQVLDRARARYGATPPTLDFVQAELANAYGAAGQHAKAEQLLRDGLERARKQFGSADPRTAAAMGQLGMNLVQQRNWAEAEPLLRRALAIRQARLPDDWVTFDSRSLLGGLLLDRKIYAEAEPLLVSGYEGLQARAARIPARYEKRLAEAGARVVALYAAWGQNDKAEKWRARLSTATKPARPGP